MEVKAPKLLVVTGETLSAHLAEYALRVALRLDMEVVVLFVDENSGIADREGALEAFASRIEGEAARFSLMAWEQGIGVTTIVDLEDRLTAISRVQDQDPDIRFLLTEPLEEEEAGSAGDSHHPCLTVLSRET